MNLDLRENVHGHRYDSQEDGEARDRVKHLGRSLQNARVLPRADDVVLDDVVAG